MSRFDTCIKFEKEFERLSKKYKTLSDDLEKFKEVLLAHPTGIGKNFTIIHVMGDIKIVKARMACRTLRDRSLRVIYAYHEQEQKITLIELYYKGDKENEDRGRIEQYLKAM